MSNKSQRTRQFIIEQTAAVFNARGFAGTSLSDLAEATGLTKGSIYGNFENKDEVALAAFDYNFGKVVEHIRDKMNCRHSIIEKLLVYPEVYRTFLKQPLLKAGCPILNTGSEADDTHPLLRKRAAKALEFWRQSIIRQIESGKCNGEIKKDTDADQFSSILMSIVEGAILQAKVNGHDRELIHSMDFLTRMIKDLSSVKIKPQKIKFK